MQFEGIKPEYWAATLWNKLIFKTDQNQNDRHDDHYIEYEQCMYFWEKIDRQLSWNFQLKQIKTWYIWPLKKLTF